MLQVTEGAMAAIKRSMLERSVPEGHGVRFYLGPARHGALDIFVGFAESPASSDLVERRDGIDLYLAAEVAERLSTSILDANPQRTRLGLQRELVIRSAHPVHRGSSGSSPDGRRPARLTVVR